MDLRKHRVKTGLSERDLAEKILESMGVKPSAKNYERKLRNMVEYVKRWEAKDCNPSKKYMGHVTAATNREVTANSFYQ